MADESYVEVVKKRLQALHSNVSEAVKRTGNENRNVRLIAVTKYIGISEVQGLVQAGVMDAGENRWQVAKDKVESFPELNWHFIGPLQRNKVKNVVRHFSCIQSVDRPDLADDISRIALELGKRPNVLLQVNVSDESQKSGVNPEGAKSLLEYCARLPGIHVQGLMSIALHTSNENELRAEFRALRTLRDELVKSTGVSLPELSMGMSDDYEIAVEEGATMIRIGRILVLKEMLAQ